MKKLHPCANCGAHITRYLFCQACYSLVDGSTKHRFNRALRVGQPLKAIRIVRANLEDLRKGGIPVPAARADAIGRRVIVERRAA